MSDTVIKVENISKFYQLGLINHGTLAKDLQAWWAKIRGKDDPNSRISLVNPQNSDKNTDFIYALKDVSFDVKQGEVLGIIGANGAGKSTLLKILSRVTSPTSGCIKIKGRIGSLLEVGTGFHPELTGRENIYLNGAILGMRKHEIDRKLDEIIDFSGVEKFIDTPVKRYSSGMYVRLAFAVAAHLDPEILVVDEVLAVGDADFQKKCLGKMDDVSKKEGRTVLFVSHNMMAVRQLCTRGILLRNGELVFDGEVESGIKFHLNQTVIKEQYINLKDYPRPYDFLGKEMHINSLRFVNWKNGIYTSNEPIAFDIEWESFVDAHDIYFYFVIEFDDGSRVGLAETTQIESVQTNQKYSTHCKLFLDNLANGKYTFKINLYTKNSFGQHRAFDHIAKRIQFEIDYPEKNTLHWLHQYYGHVKLNTVKIKNTCLSDSSKNEFV